MSELSTNGEPRTEDYQRLRPMIKLPDSVLGQREDERPLADFTLLTYNVLAQDHIHRTAYPYCAKMTLHWRQRKQRLTEEITAYDADIVCFQEMDRFHDYFQPLLFRLGYDLCYILRNGPKSDVNCVGWKKEKFDLLGSKQVSFAGTTMGLGSVPNVAQLVALRPRLLLESETMQTEETRPCLIIATSHFYWKEEFDHIRLVQMHALITEMHRFREDELSPGNYSLIIAGDLNSDRPSMAIQAALQTDFLMDHAALVEMQQRAQMSPEVLRALLADFTVNWTRFHDAHEHYSMLIPGPNGYDLPYTTFCLYKGILDHILYTQYGSRSALRIAPKALRMLPDRQLLESEGALPNNIYASDHLALMVQFAIFSRATQANKGPSSYN